MNHSNATDAAVKKPCKKSKKPHSVQGGSSEANRFAVVILEVLAGGRTPADAAQVLGVTLPRYYQLEARALNGLVAALEPRPSVRQPSTASRIAQLEKALGEARQEGLRQQALVRAAQRSLGIRSPVVVETKGNGNDAVKRKKRRPVVRALKAAQTLANDTRQPAMEMLQQEHSATCPGQSLPQRDGEPPGKTPIVQKGTLE
jgi:hypothetical protein